MRGRLVESTGHIIAAESFYAASYRLPSTGRGNEIAKETRFANSGRLAIFTITLSDGIRLSKANSGRCSAIKVKGLDEC